MLVCVCVCVGRELVMIGRRLFRGVDCMKTWQSRKLIVEKSLVVVG